MLQKPVEQMTFDEIREEMRLIVEELDKNKNENYVFISYSHVDAEILYRQLLPLMRRGYNIYLDVDFENHSSDMNWINKAYNKITSMHCKAFICYISVHYFTSYAALIELLSVPVSRRAVPIERIRPSSPIYTNVEELLESEEYGQKYSDKWLYYKKIMNDRFLSHNNAELEQMTIGFRNVCSKLREIDEQYFDNEQSAMRCLSQAFSNDAETFFWTIEYCMNTWFKAYSLTGNDKSFDKLNEDMMKRYNIRSKRFIAAAEVSKPATESAVVPQSVLTEPVIHTVTEKTAEPKPAPVPEKPAAPKPVVKPAPVAQKTSEPKPAIKTVSMAQNSGSDKTTTNIKLAKAFSICGKAVNFRDDMMLRDKIRFVVNTWIDSAEGNDPNNLCDSAATPNETHKGISYVITRSLVDELIKRNELVLFEEHIKNTVSKFVGKVAGSQEEFGEAKYARMDMHDDNYIVLKDSYIRIKREITHNKGVLSQWDDNKSSLAHARGDFYILTQDIAFRSISAAAAFVCSGSVNGNLFWQPYDGAALPDEAVLNNEATVATETANPVSSTAFVSYQGKVVGSAEEFGDNKYTYLEERDNKFVVLKGSYIRIKRDITHNKAVLSLWDENYSFLEHSSGDFYILQRDVEISSKSTAAVFSCSGSISGNVFWKPHGDTNAQGDEQVEKAYHLDGVSDFRLAIDKLMTAYLNIKNDSMKEHPVALHVTKTLPRLLNSTGFIDPAVYHVEGSAGKGRFALVPWLAIFNKSVTTSACNGVYIVYLLSMDCKRLYLTLNRGCTNMLEEYKGKGGKTKVAERMRELANEITDEIDCRGFSTDEGIVLGAESELHDSHFLYQKGSICYKEYIAGELPSNDEMLNDLKDMLAIYEDCINLFGSDC